MSATVFFVDSQPPKFYASQPLTPSSLATISQCKLEYLNEGGANFVFRILSPTDQDELTSKLQGKLLRLRKNLPHVQRAEDQFRALQENFQPLFPPENLVRHDLVSLDPDVLTSLNSILQTLVRPGHRSGDYLPTDEDVISGLLVTDMTPSAGEILLQLKPKWLTQSPNAPPNARRCRTCAVRAQRAAERIRTATDAQEACPLNLVNTDIAERKLAVQPLTTDRRLREYLSTTAQPLLQQLRASQLSLDSVGTLQTTSIAQIQDLCKAMTLRDCTLFVKRSGNAIEARLADLDLKQPEKLHRWKKVERELVEGGWYTNSEREGVWKKEGICLLSKSGSG